MSIRVKDMCSLKPYFDEIEEANGDEECFSWLRQLLAAEAELAVFVAEWLGRSDAKQVVRFLKG